MDSDESGKRSDLLLSLIERIERLEEEKRALADDIGEIYREAKTKGFEPKIMRAMVRERRMDEASREEERALLDIYRAALGMLDGTPLGDAARRRLMRSKPDAAPAPKGDGSGPSGSPGDAAEDPAPELPLPPPIVSPEDLLTARAEGGAAAKGGKRITDNPYPAGNARRGAWDEGWCAASGSDGMDIPTAWRRSKPPKGASSPPPPPPGGE
jgi:uncharacterized protein (UPF0335 family)